MSRDGCFGPTLRGCGLTWRSRSCLRRGRSAWGFCVVVFPVLAGLPGVLPKEPPSVVDVRGLSLPLVPALPPVDVSPPCSDPNVPPQRRRRALLVAAALPAAAAAQGGPAAAAAAAQRGPPAAEGAGRAGAGAHRAAAGGGAKAAAHAGGGLLGRGAEGAATRGHR